MKIIYEFNRDGIWEKLDRQYVKEELVSLLDAIAENRIGLMGDEDYEIRLGSSRWRARKVGSVELRPVFLVKIENDDKLVSEFLRWMIDNEIVDLGLGHVGRDLLVKVLPSLYKAEVDAFFRSRNAR